MPWGGFGVNYREALGPTEGLVGLEDPVLTPPPPPPYTPTQKLSPAGLPTSSAHPARFSPDDRFSRHRLALKRRFGVLPTQRPRPLL